MTTETVPRGLLLQLTTNPQMIRYLEQLGVDAQAAPLALEQVQGVAQNAGAVAASAGIAARRAERLAEQLQVERASSAGLRSQVAMLARRVTDLETLVRGRRR